VVTQPICLKVILLGKLNTQFGITVKKGDISKVDINKNQGLLDEYYFTPSVFEKNWVWSDKYFL